MLSLSAVIIVKVLRLCAQTMVDESIRIQSCRLLQEMMFLTPTKEDFGGHADFVPSSMNRQGVKVQAFDDYR